MQNSTRLLLQLDLFKQLSEEAGTTYRCRTPDFSDDVAIRTMLSIVASCECCFGRYRQKIEESSHANGMTSFSDHNAYQDRNTYDLSASVPVITTTKTKAKSQHDSFLISTRASQLVTSLGARRLCYELAVKHGFSYVEI
jgi:hypothetical protein